MRYMGDIIEGSTDALRDWFFDHLQGHYPIDETPTFEEWLDGLTNTELLYYLSIGEEIYYERSYGE